MWGKVLTGVAVGVGAVAVAPFTGGGSVLAGATVISSLAGAGTIAAAAGAGVVGAATGAVLAEVEKEGNDNNNKAAYEAGKEEGMAVAAQRVEVLEKKLTQALQQLKSHDKHFKAMIALEAVGVACAACDDDFSDAEREEIGEFVKGMMAQDIPESVKTRIQDIYDNPPTVREAFALADGSGVELSLFEELIEFVMEIDGITQEEQTFVHAWNQLKAA